MKCQNCAPKTNINTQVFSNWDPLDDPVGRIFDGEDSDVNTRGQPGILSMSKVSTLNEKHDYILYLLTILQVRILFDSHNGGERHGSLVKGLQEICADHDNKDPTIDQFPKTFVGLLVDFHLSVGGVGLNFLVHAGDIHVVFRKVIARKNLLHMRDVLLALVFSHVDILLLGGCYLNSLVNRNRLYPLLGLFVALSHCEITKGTSDRVEYATGHNTQVKLAISSAL